VCVVTRVCVWSLLRVWSVLRGGRSPVCGHFSVCGHFPVCGHFSVSGHSPVSGHFSVGGQSPMSLPTPKLLNRDVGIEHTISHSSRKTDEWSNEGRYFRGHTDFVEVYDPHCTDIRLILKSGGASGSLWRGVSYPFDWLVNHLGGSQEGLCGRLVHALMVTAKSLESDSNWRYGGWDSRVCWEDICRVKFY